MKPGPRTASTLASPYLGLAGRSRSGKTTVEHLLWLHHGFHSIAFADALKRLVVSIFDIQTSVLWGPPASRDGGIVPFDAHDRTCYAQRLLAPSTIRMLRELTGEHRRAVLFSERLETLIQDDKWPERVTVRKVLQRVGDAGREINVDLWVDYAVKMAKALNAGRYGYSSYLGIMYLTDADRIRLRGARVVFTDVRHGNEAAAVRRLGGPVWWLEADKRSPPNPAIAHVSEPSRADLAQWITHDLDRNGTEHGGYEPKDPTPINEALLTPAPRARRDNTPFSLMHLPGDAKGWMCQHCYRHYQVCTFGRDTEDQARVCCQKECDEDGCPEPRPNYGLYCDRHQEEHQARRERERFERATKVDLKDYDGPFYVPDGPHEGFFVDMGTLLDAYDGDEFNRELPEYAYTVKKRTPDADAWHHIEHVLEDHHEGASENLDGVEELQAFLTAWWEKQKIESWDPDWDHVVLLPAPEVSPSDATS